MADDRWNNRSEDRSMERDWRRDERDRYSADRDEGGGMRSTRRGPDQGGYGSGGYGQQGGGADYGRGYYGASTHGSGGQGLAAPGSFTEYGGQPSGGYPASYGSPTTPPAAAWMGASGRGGGQGYSDQAYGRQDYKGRAAEQRSFGEVNPSLQRVSDGEDGHTLMGGEHRGRGPRNYKRSDDRICEEINDRLTEDAWLDAQDIDVNVQDREVTLNGFVADRNAKRRAEQLAEEVSGVDHVQNNLRVRRAEDTASAGSEADSRSSEL